MRAAKSLVVILGLLATTFVGCGGAGKSFQLDGYYHEQYPFRVAARTQGADGLLGGEWQIDNYQRDKKGHLVGRKQGDKYEGVLSFDLNDDGIADETSKYPRYEVLLTNRHSDGEIWLSTIPLSGKNAEKDLQVLLDRYVEGISGTGSVVVISMADVQKTVVADKRYATRVTELRKVQLDGVDGLAATIEVANVDQLQLSPNSRWARARLVFVRPGFRYALGANSVGAATHSWPVLVVVGYSNGTVAFDSGLPDFERFLSGIDFMSDDEVVGRYANAIVDCVGQETAPVDFQIDGTGSVTGIPSNAKPCLRRIVGNLKFSAQGTRRAYRAAVTRNTPAAPGPQGYRSLEVIQSDTTAQSTAATNSAATNSAATNSAATNSAATNSAP